MIDREHKLSVVRQEALLGFLPWQRLLLPRSLMGRLSDQVYLRLYPTIVTNSQ